MRRRKPWRWSGGGPAGLAAAYQLRKKGHAVVIFDDHDALGGMMRYGIPGYRTPRDYLNHEIQRILDMGNIDVRLSTRGGAGYQRGSARPGVRCRVVVHRLSDRSFFAGARGGCAKLR